MKPTKEPRVPEPKTFTCSHVWVGYVGGVMCVKCSRIYTGLIERLIRLWLKWKIIRNS